jgi:hypothetical protein
VRCRSVWQWNSCWPRLISQRQQQVAMAVQAIPAQRLPVSFRLRSARRVTTGLKEFLLDDERHSHTGLGYCVCDDNTCKWNASTFDKG